MYFSVQFVRQKSERVAFAAPMASRSPVDVSDVSTCRRVVPGPFGMLHLQIRCRFPRQLGLNIFPEPFSPFSPFSALKFFWDFEVLRFGQKQNETERNKTKQVMASHGKS